MSDSNELDSKEAGDFIDFTFESVMESIDKRVESDDDKCAIIMSLSQLLASAALCERAAYECPYDVLRSVTKLASNIANDIHNFAHLEEHEYE